MDQNYAIPGAENVQGFYNTQMSQNNNAPSALGGSAEYTAHTGNNNYTPVPVPNGTPTVTGTTRPSSAGGLYQGYGAAAQEWLYRDQYRDFQRRFEPIEREYIDSVLGAEKLDERLAAISINNPKAFNVAKDNANVRRQRYGLSLDGDEQAAYDRQMNYSEALSTTDAQNNARTHTYDQRLNAIWGGGARQTLAETGK